MRWIDIDLENFAIAQQGFDSRRIGDSVLYHSPGLGRFDRIEDLRNVEYAQVVLVDRARRCVRFGRDYLGHYPLSYACDGRHLVLSDSYNFVLQALLARGRRPAISEEGLALYFTMGFVPHGLSPYRDVVNCEATGHYECERGRVRRVDTFEPIAISASDEIGGIRDAIETEVRRVARDGAPIDVWCSGGLDSSIMSVLFNRGGRSAELLTLSYGDEIHAQIGDGERRFVKAVSDFTGARMRDVLLDPAGFEAFHAVFARQHNAPVMDFPLAPKYALCAGSRDIAVTGEAGDTFFGGTKNAAIAYARQMQPHVSIGEHYAVAHHRFFRELPKIFRRGEELQAFAVEHCERLAQRYPGDLQRKLFYLNAHEKLSSMIFAQSYLPAQLFGKRVRHPIASLGVYRAAFAVPDHRKFSYPDSKIALHELYGQELPPAVPKRKKSGTQLPLQHYLRCLGRDKFDFSRLSATGLFRESLLHRLASPAALDAYPPLFLYAFITLNLWLQTKETCHADPVPAQAGHMQPAATGAAL